MPSISACTDSGAPIRFPRQSLTRMGSELVDGGQYTSFEVHCIVSDMVVHQTLQVSQEKSEGMDLRSES